MNFISAYVYYPVVITMQALSDIPSWIVTAWGINLVSAQIIMSTAVMFAFVMPILVLRKERTSFNVEIVAAFMGLAVCVGLGWLHYWVLVVIVVLIAVAVAAFGTKAVFGGD